MTTTANWQTISPANITGFDGMGADNGSGGLQTGLAEAQMTPAASAAPWWSPDSPLFWFGVIAAATVGLFAASISAKAGPAKASVSI